MARPRAAYGPPTIKLSPALKGKATAASTSTVSIALKAREPAASFCLGPCSASLPSVAGSSPAARRRAKARALRANELMYFALMRHARARGCLAFDFGRSKVGSGPFAYKKNWGFEPQPLAYAVRTADGQAPREVNPLSPKYRAQIAIWKKLPLWLANRLGPPIARGLG